MELPVAPESYEPTTEALVRAVKRVEAILARVSAQESSLGGATVFVNPERAGVVWENFAADLRTSDEMDAQGVLDEVRSHYATMGVACCSLDAAGGDWQPGLAEAATGAGYRAVTCHVYLLKRHRPSKKVNESVQVIPARASYKEVGALFAGMARDEYGAEGGVAADMAQSMVDQLDEPRLELFLGRLDGGPVGVAGVTTLGQMGVVYPAYTGLSGRGQGVGPTLMTHTLDHCARALMGQVLLMRVEGCPSIGFYEGLGFERVGSYVKYVL